MRNGTEAIPYVDDVRTRSVGNGLRAVPEFQHIDENGWQKRNVSCREKVREPWKRAQEGSAGGGARAPTSETVRVEMYLTASGGCIYNLWEHGGEGW